MRYLTISLLILSLASVAKADTIKWCFIICTVATEAPADSFCQMYQSVIQNQSEAKEVGKLSSRPRRAVNKNEVAYRCLCQKWDDPICKQPQEVPK